MKWPAAIAASAIVPLVAMTPALASEGLPPEDACEVTAWTMTWGVKESFRAYLSGAIAQGEWQTDGDVSYSTPEFVVTGSAGWLGSDGTSGELWADGSIRFIGHGGILDQTLSSPAVDISEDNLTLIFDVEGDTQEGLSVRSDAVLFAEATVRSEIDSEAGRWRVEQAPTVLTPEGAEAFGTYPAGEQMDPVSIEVSVQPGCLSAAGLFTQPLAWVASATVLAAALAGAVTVWVRRSRGPERPTPRES
jgi:hypothetical protein